MQLDALNGVYNIRFATHETLMRTLTLTLSAMVCAVSALYITPTIMDRLKNSIEVTKSYAVSTAAAQLHEKLFIADMHSDALLWSRDILVKHSYGHSDLPRLQMSNVGLQVFFTVTKTPRNLNYDSNSDSSDNITPLAILQSWPMKTWDNLLERALYQSKTLHEAADRSHGQLRIIKTQEDLIQLLTDRDKTPGLMGSVLGMEGLHPLGSNLDNIDVIDKAGFRVAGLTHFIDNEVAGSAHGSHKGGLTPFGRQAMAKLEERKILIDLSHASSQAIDDALALATRPLLVSHTGVRGTCDNNRNLSDAQMKAIAATGGVIGIAFFKEAICELNTQAIVKAIRYTANLVGVKHVALGSDNDGAVRVVFNGSELVRLTQALMDDGFSQSDIAAIMGGNVRDLLLAQLPKRLVQAVSPDISATQTL